MDAGGRLHEVEPAADVQPADIAVDAEGWQNAMAVGSWTSRVPVCAQSPCLQALHAVTRPDTTTPHLTVSCAGNVDPGFMVRDSSSDEDAAAEDGGRVGAVENPTFAEVARPP